MRLPAGILSFLLSRARRVMGRRDPDFIIGTADSPYIRRWWMLPRNRLFNIYLHEIMRDDDDRALHDHPWLNCSIILSGGYWECLPGDIRIWRPAGSVTFRRSVARHRIELERGQHTWWRLRAVSLFLTGPRIRVWGFHCPQGFVRWHDFVAENPGEVGKGCEQ